MARGISTTAHETTTHPSDTQRRQDDDDEEERQQYDYDYDEEIYANGDQNKSEDVDDDDDDDDDDGQPRTPLFWKVDRNRPTVFFFFQPSSFEPSSESVLDAIENNGGKVTAELAEADVILVQRLQRSTESIMAKIDPNNETLAETLVETVDWLLECLKLGEFEHTEIRNMYSQGGRRVGEKGNLFTPLHKAHLMWYVAHRAPELPVLVSGRVNTDRGGRAGNKIYKQLCQSERPWAKHHTWKAWRDQYFKNAGFYNSHISRYLRENPIQGSTADRRVIDFEDEPFCMDDEVPLTNYRQFLALSDGSGSENSASWPTKKHARGRAASEPESPTSRHQMTKTQARHRPSFEDDGLNPPFSETLNSHENPLSTLISTQNRLASATSPVKKKPWTSQERRIILAGGIPPGIDLSSLAEADQAADGQPVLATPIRRRPQSPTHSTRQRSSTPSKAVDNVARMVASVMSIRSTVVSRHARQSPQAQPPTTSKPCAQRRPHSPVEEAYFVSPMRDVLHPATAPEDIPPPVSSPSPALAREADSQKDQEPPALSDDDAEAQRQVSFAPVTNGVPRTKARNQKRKQIQQMDDEKEADSANKKAKRRRISSTSTPSWVTPLKNAENGIRRPSSTTSSSAVAAPVPSGSLVPRIDLRQQLMTMAIRRDSQGTPVHNALPASWIGQDTSTKPTRTRRVRAAAGVSSSAQLAPTVGEAHENTGAQGTQYRLRSRTPLPDVLKPFPSRRSGLSHVRV